MNLEQIDSKEQRPDGKDRALLTMQNAQTWTTISQDLTRQHQLQQNARENEIHSLTALTLSRFGDIDEDKNGKLSIQELKHDAAKPFLKSDDRNATQFALDNLKAIKDLRYDEPLEHSEITKKDLRVLSTLTDGLPNSTGRLGWETKGLYTYVPGKGALVGLGATAGAYGLMTLTALNHEWMSPDVLFSKPAIITTLALGAIAGAIVHDLYVSHKAKNFYEARRNELVDLRLGWTAEISKLPPVSS